MHEIRLLAPFLFCTRRIAKSAFLTTVKCRYNAVQYITILHRALRKQWQKTNQILESQQTPHFSPSRASYGMSIVRIMGRIDRIITAPRCICWIIAGSDEYSTKSCQFQKCWKQYKMSFLTQILNIIMKIMTGITPQFNYPYAWRVSPRRSRITPTVAVITMMSWKLQSVGYHQQFRLLLCVWIDYRGTVLTSYARKFAPVGLWCIHTTAWQTAWWILHNFKFRA